MLEELLKELRKDLEKKNKELRKLFIEAEKLGLRNGDKIRWKDGTISYVEDAENQMIKYKNIETVERPVEWEEIKIRKPRFGRRKKGE